MSESFCLGPKGVNARPLSRGGAHDYRQPMGNWRYPAPPTTLGVDLCLLPLSIALAYADLWGAFLSVRGSR